MTALAWWKRGIVVCGDCHHVGVLSLSSCVTDGTLGGGSMGPILEGVGSVDMMGYSLMISSVSCRPLSEVQRGTVCFVFLC